MFEPKATFIILLLPSHPSSPTSSCPAAPTGGTAPAAPQILNFFQQGGQKQEKWAQQESSIKTRNAALWVLSTTTTTILSTYNLSYVWILSTWHRSPNYFQESCDITQLAAAAERARTIR